MPYHTGSPYVIYTRFLFFHIYTGRGASVYRAGFIVVLSRIARALLFGFYNFGQGSSMLGVKDSRETYAPLAILALFSCRTSSITS